VGDDHQTGHQADQQCDAENQSLRKVEHEPASGPEKQWIVVSQQWSEKSRISASIEEPAFHSKLT
jgi:hypothetical protein